jgi:hypothetical protein
VLESALELVEDQALRDKLTARLHLLESTQASLHGLEQQEKEREGKTWPPPSWSQNQQ